MTLYNAFQSFYTQVSNYKHILQSVIYLGGLLICDIYKTSKHQIKGQILSQLHLL